MDKKSFLDNFALQFITNADSEGETLRQAEAVLRGGCRWVQLRMKDAGKDAVERIGRKMVEMCREAGATLIIDDHADICRIVGADGVHLGKGDMPLAEARKLLGDKYIIGATCNTADDVFAAAPHADYIGCGPFRFTTTKKNLAPTLGIEGYEKLTWAVRSQGVNIPIVAIGGITVSDIPDILSAGPDGIALSGEITRADEMTLRTDEIVETINNHKTRQR